MRSCAGPAMSIGNAALMLSESGRGENIIIGDTDVSNEVDCGRLSRVAPRKSRYKLPRGSAQHRAQRCTRLTSELLTPLCMSAESSMLVVSASSMLNQPCV